MLKNRAEKMKNIKVQSIKNANESFNQRMIKRTGSVDFKQFDKEYETRQLYMKIRSDRSRYTPMNKKKTELMPFDRRVCFFINILYTYNIKI